MLLTLPLELRNMIYRELLLWEDCAMQPQTYCGRRRRPVNKKIDTTILRACKQVYSEALAILYEENLFLYLAPPSRYAYESVTRGDKITEENFKRIKHIEFVVEVFDYQSHEEEVNGMFAHFACSLRTFRITFSFQYYTEGSKGEFKFTPYIIENKVLLQSLARLDVQEKLQIIIGSDYVETYEAFEKFAINLGFLKQWAIIPDKATNDNTSDEGSTRYKSHCHWPRGTSRTYTLQPATASTLTSVPQSLSVGPQTA